MIKIISDNEKLTIELAQKLSKYLKPGDIVCLFGELGTGKTTFVKGLAKGLKVKPQKVHSPTFTLLNIYDGKLPLYHFDLYRIEDIKELGAIGYEEFFYGEGVAVVEWAERLKELMPQEYFKVEIEHRQENERLIRLSACGEKYSRIIDKIKSLPVPSSELRVRQLGIRNSPTRN